VLFYMFTSNYYLSIFLVLHIILRYAFVYCIVKVQVFIAAVTVDVTPLVSLIACFLDFCFI
jgi:hypothetical protein